MLFPLQWLDRAAAQEKDVDFPIADRVSHVSSFVWSLLFFSQATLVVFQAGEHVRQSDPFLMFVFGKGCPLDFSMVCVHYAACVKPLGCTLFPQCVWLRPYAPCIGTRQWQPVISPHTFCWTQAKVLLRQNYFEARRQACTRVTCRCLMWEVWFVWSRQRTLHHHRGEVAWEHTQLRVLAVEFLVVYQGEG